MSETLSSGRGESRKVVNGNYFIDVNGDFGSGVTIDWSVDGSNWNPLQETIGVDLNLTGDSNFIATLATGHLSLYMSGSGNVNYTITKL